MIATAHHPGEAPAQMLETLGVTPTELVRQFYVPTRSPVQTLLGRAFSSDLDAASKRKIDVA